MAFSTLHKRTTAVKNNFFKNIQTNCKYASHIKHLKISYSKHANGKNPISSSVAVSSGISK
jgi:hypothetical protein